MLLLSFFLFELHFAFQNANDALKRKMTGFSMTKPVPASPRIYYGCKPVQKVVHCSTPISALPVASEFLFVYLFTLVVAFLQQTTKLLPRRRYNIKRKLNSPIYPKQTQESTPQYYINKKRRLRSDMPKTIMLSLTVYLPTS